MFTGRKQNCFFLVPVKRKFHFLGHFDFMISCFKDTDILSEYFFSYGKLDKMCFM